MPRTLQLKATTNEPQGDGASETAVTIVWHELKATSRTSTVPVRLKNTTDEAQRIELRLTGFTPENDAVEHKFAEFILPANSKRVVPIHIDDLPVQSSGNAGGIRVAALYEPADAKVPSPTLVFTEPLMLTFDADFKTATARTQAEQIRENARAPSVTSLLEKRGEVRVKSAQSGAFAARTERDSMVQRGPVITVEHVGPPPDFKNATHAPDTEAPRGDQ